MFKYEKNNAMFMKILNARHCSKWHKVTGKHPETKSFQKKKKLGFPKYVTVKCLWQKKKKKKEIFKGKIKNSSEKEKSY